MKKSERRAEMKNFLDERLHSSSFITNNNNDTNTDIAAFVNEGSIVFTNCSEENGKNKS